MWLEWRRVCCPRCAVRGGEGDTIDDGAAASRSDVLSRDRENGASLQSCLTTRLLRVAPARVGIAHRTLT